MMRRTATENQNQHSIQGIRNLHIDTTRAGFFRSRNGEVAEWLKALPC